MSRTLILVSSCWLLVSGSSCAQEADPVFIVNTIEGGAVAGPLQKLGEGGIRLGGERPTLVPLADVIRIRRKNRLLPPMPRNNFVILTNGNRIPWTDKLPRLDEGRLHFQVGQGTKASAARLPRSFVSILWLTAPDGMDADLMLHRLAQSRRSQDVLYLRNGDRVEGRLLAIHVKGFTIETGNRPATVDAARVACLALNSELQAHFRPTAAYYHVMFDDGGRIDFTSLQLAASGKQLQGKTLFGTKLTLALDEVAAIEPRHDKVVYLSVLKPRAYEHTPYLDLKWPLVTDAAVTGQPLLLAGNTYDKGLGLHAHSQVSYALGGGYRWFEALVGMDARIAPKGRARIRVLLDGKEQDIGAKSEITPGAAPLAIRLDVRNARELTLETAFGSGGDVQARVNWADARVLR